MRVIRNPVLRGFSPDPSILRVEDDYYIATSTFEWFPGVRIYHSRDLEHWRLASRPLDRVDLLDMRGSPNSGGIWAPCLSWSGGTFYLVYTDMKRWAGQVKDCHNYLTTAPSIEGPWSEKVPLNSSGFDASLFHDEDGRKWLLSMLWDYRPSQSGFGGILLQEYSPEKRRLVGEASLVFSGTELGLVEGPHLYRKGRYYYLVTAEGGTFVTHAVSVARAATLRGPYTVMPGNPLLSSAHDPSLPLQSAGHGSLVETRAGEWVLAHLCRRPAVRGRSVLGRETALQRVEWTAEGWPRLKQGGRSPSLEFIAPDLPCREWEQEPARDDFEGPVLRTCYQSLRVPLDDSLMSLTERPGYLRLKGAESILSNFRQALVARRISAFTMSAATCVEFEPETFQQLAGLAAFYSTESFYYLYVSRAAHSSKCLGLMRCERGVVTFLLEKEHPVDGCRRVHLGFDMDYERLSFRYSLDGSRWSRIGGELDSSILSDEHALPCGFTGACVALCCQDLGGGGRHADFDYLSYAETGT
ncbi:MAG: glycoside hydrolase family 43 protein [Spirochaetia bacterium]|jgi:xylan 1,4-beta-xylosidase